MNENFRVGLALSVALVLFSAVASWSFMRQVTQLITQGIFLESESPQNLYTRLAEARSAQMGVLQITAADSDNVSDYGENDTKSLDNDINAVVDLLFAME